MRNIILFFIKTLVFIILSTCYVVLETEETDIGILKRIRDPEKKKIEYWNIGRVEYFDIMQTLGCIRSLKSEVAL